MAGFFSKLFGSSKKKSNNASTTVELAENIMNELLEKAGFDLSFSVSSEMNQEIEELQFNIEGPDANLITDRDGAVLDALQMFIKRVLQHQLPEARLNVSFDCNGFREESNKALIELAEKLRDRALEQGRSVYVRALAPKDRKVVHQFLSTDERVRSRSVGEGLYKKIKIYPVKASQQDDANDASENA